MARHPDGPARGARPASRAAGHHRHGAHTRAPAGGLPRPGTVALGLSGWVAVASVLAAAPVPVRAIAVFGFAVSCPGLALVSLVSWGDALERVVLAVALSVSLATLLAEGMALVQVWSPVGALIGLAALSTVAVGARVVRDRRGGGTGRRRPGEEATVPAGGVDTQ